LHLGLWAHRGEYDHPDGCRAGGPGGLSGYGPRWTEHALALHLRSGKRWE
jgi:hypothetical protein